MENLTQTLKPANVLSQYIVNLLRFQNIHTFTYQKALLHTLLLLVFKIVESLQCILNEFPFKDPNICRTDV